METQELIASLALAQEAAVTYTDIDQAQDMLQINWDTRAVTIPKSVTNAGVKNDHLSKKLVFSMDRYVCGVDLANHTFAIHFINVDKWDSKKKNYDDCASGVYPVTNIDLSVDGKVTCEWEITNAATQVVGDVVFALHVFTIVDSAFTYHLGTTPTLLDLLDTVNATEHGKNITPDEIEVYIQKMADLSAEIDAKVAAAEAAATRAEEAAANFEVDDTLSVAGKAADAAATGAKLSQLSSENAELKGDLIQLNSEKLILCSYSIDTTNGKAYQTNTRLCNLHFIPVKNLSLVIAPENYAFITAMYDCNNNYIGHINWRKTLSKQMISSDCCFVRLVFRLTENTNNDISENATSVSHDTKVMYSIDMITNKVWNAIENGCDNTGETDCKEIIQNALDSGLYHAFYFPSGEYYLSDYVTLRNLTSVKFHGDGIGNTIFNCGRDGFRIFGGSNITIENFDIVGSGNVDTSAIRFRDDTPDTLECRIGFSTVKNIYIRNFGVGIDFNAPSGYNYFEKVKVSANLDGSVGWAIGNTFANTGDIIPNYIYLDKCQVDGQSNINAECAISISCGQMIFINHCDFCNIVNGYGIKILNNNENNERIQHIYMINNSIYNVKYGLFVQSRTDTQIIGIDFSHNMVVCSDVDSPTAIAILKKDDARSVIRVNIIANSITGFLSEFEKINITGVSEYSSYIAGNFN